MYIDAGHGGTVGWDANLKPAAAELSAVYKEAESPSQVRGIAVNTAGWNSWYVFLTFRPFLTTALSRQILNMV